MLYPEPLTRSLITAGHNDLQMNVQKFSLLVTVLFNDLMHVSRQHRSISFSYFILFSLLWFLVKHSSIFVQIYCKTGMTSSTSLSLSVLQSHLPRQDTVLAATFWEAALVVLLVLWDIISWHKDSTWRQICPENIRCWLIAPCFDVQPSLTI